MTSRKFLRPRSTNPCPLGFATERVEVIPVVATRCKSLLQGARAGDGASGMEGEKNAWSILPLVKFLQAVFELRCHAWLDLDGHSPCQTPGLHLCAAGQFNRQPQQRQQHKDFPHGSFLPFGFSLGSFRAPDAGGRVSLPHG